METQKVLEAIQQTLTGSSLHGATVTGAWAKWLHGESDRPSPDESLTIVLVTADTSIDRRTMAKLSASLEQRLAISEVYFSRLTKAEWNNPRDNFTKFIKKDHLWPLNISGE